MKFRYSRLALSELEKILSDLASKNPATAQRFELRVRQVSERMGRFPHAYQEVAERPGIRRVPFVRYPYVAFYKVFEDEVIVLRIVHGARREPWENL